MTVKSRHRFYAWLQERYDLDPLVTFMRHKRVPLHRHTVLYYLGGVTLFLFGVQVLTGVLLLLYYQPGIDTGYESVRFIMTEVKFGWLFRSIHSWSANLMIVFAFLHMFSTFFTRAYARPRELTWVTGFILLLLATGLGFSGYLLPWDELAFFATKVGTDIAGAVPIVGGSIKELLRGGPDVTGATMTRFYAFHIALIPALFTVILGLHLLFVQRQGMHAPAAYEALPDTKKKDIPFFPSFLLRDVLLWLVVLNLLLYVAVFWPAHMGIKADPFTSAPEGIRPEWYFMFMFQTLKVLPAHILGMEGEVLGILFFGFVMLAWLTVPFWEPRLPRSERLRPMTVIGVVAIIFIVVMTIWGYLF